MAPNLKFKISSFQYFLIIFVIPLFGNTSSLLNYKARFLTNYSEFEFQDNKIVLFHIGIDKNAVIFNNEKYSLTRTTGLHKTQFIYSAIIKGVNHKVLINKFDNRKIEVGYFTVGNLVYNKENLAKTICNARSSQSANILSLQEEIQTLSKNQFNFNGKILDEKSCANIDEGQKDKLIESLQTFLKGKKDAIVNCLENAKKSEVINNDIFYARYFAALKMKILDIISAVKSKPNFTVKCLDDPRNLGECKIAENGIAISIDPQLVNEGRQDELRKVFMHELLHVPDQQPNKCLSEFFAKQFENICSKSIVDYQFVSSADVIKDNCKDKSVLTSVLSVRTANSKIGEASTGADVATYSEYGINSSVDSQMQIGNSLSRPVIDNAQLGRVDLIAQDSFVNVISGQKPSLDGSANLVVSRDASFDRNIELLSKGMSDLGNSLYNTISSGIGNAKNVNPLKATAASVAPNATGSSLAKDNIQLLSPSQLVQNLYPKNETFDLPSSKLPEPSQVATVAKAQMAAADVRVPTGTGQGVGSAMAGGNLKASPVSADRAPASEGQQTNQASGAGGAQNSNVVTNNITTNTTITKTTNIETGSSQVVAQPSNTVSRLPAQANADVASAQSVQVARLVTDTRMSTITGKMYSIVKQKYKDEQFGQELTTRNTTIVDSQSKNRIAGDAINPKICFEDDGKILKKMSQCPK